MRRYKGICEGGSSNGTLDTVDMQLLEDLNIVRFRVDVKKCQENSTYVEGQVKPWIYDIHFSVESTVEHGILNLDTGGPTGKRTTDNPEH